MREGRSEEATREGTKELESTNEDIERFFEVVEVLIRDLAAFRSKHQKRDKRGSAVLDPDWKRRGRNPPVRVQKLGRTKRERRIGSSQNKRQNREVEKRFDRGRSHSCHSSSISSKSEDICDAERYGEGKLSEMRTSRPRPAFLDELTVLRAHNGRVTVTADECDPGRIRRVVPVDQILSEVEKREKMSGS